MPETLCKVHIEKIAAGGEGFAHIEGKTVFIEGSAPGETILCRVLAEHRSWARAELLEIIEASPNRARPACALYGRCGGCNLQHLDYPAQLVAKTAIITEAFTRIGNFNPPQPQAVPSAPWEYRNRVQLHITRENTRGVLWGFKTRKGSEVIPAADCPIADPGIRALLQNPDRKTQTRLLPPDKDRFTIYAREGLLLSEGGTRQGKTRVLDRDLMVDAGVFFQSNGAMLETLVTDLREIAGKARRDLPMADLYCGVGTFAAFLGEQFPHIDLIEENRSALSVARKNLARFDAKAFYAQRSEHWARHSINSVRRYGFMIVDPPRQGLAPDLAFRLAANGPPLLAYVSCDPATLARDGKTLIEGGYTLTGLRWYDFYPQTALIESLAVFERYC